MRYKGDIILGERYSLILAILHEYHFDLFAIVKGETEQTCVMSILHDNAIV